MILGKGVCVLFIGPIFLAVVFYVEPKAEDADDSNLKILID